MINNFYSNHQAVSVAKGQEQKQVVLEYSRWIDTSAEALINLINHFYHPIPAMPANIHLVYICGSSYFYDYSLLTVLLVSKIPS